MCECPCFTFFVGAAERGMLAANATGATISDTAGRPERRLEQRHHVHRDAIRVSETPTHRAGAFQMPNSDWTPRTRIAATSAASPERTPKAKSRVRNRTGLGYGFHPSAIQVSGHGGGASN
jgi:hypothetical protein